MQTASAQTEHTQPSLSGESFELVPAQAVVETFKLIRPMVERLLEASKGEHSVRGVFDRIVGGQFHLWIALSRDRTKIDGIALTRFVPCQDTGHVYLLVEGASGENADFHLLNALRSIEAFALENGVKDVRVTGRKGWFRKFAKFPEWEWTHITLRKSLDG